MQKNCLILLLLVSCALSQQFSFASIGDWGCVPIGGVKEQDEIIVAKQFAAAATQVNAKFVLNTGDNFYYCGVHSKTDEMWQSTFENIFTEPSMMVPWYGALGNHDYGYPGSAEAEMEYRSPNNDRWILPNRTYYRRLSFPGEVDISLVVLDASPCQSAYISSNPAGWDPCGSVIPSCPGCTFHENVIKQSCAAQSNWLATTLASLPADDWKIVMCHAPAGDIDVVDLVKQVQDAQVDVFINGHVHLLADYTMDNQGTYITTGAGCMVDISQGKRAKDARMLRASSCPYSEKFHTCQIKWEQTIAGYTTHTFSTDFQTLTTNFYDYSGNLLHSRDTKKGGSGPVPPPGPPTPPGPSPPTPPSGTCCYHYDGTCTSGETCCTEEGKSYTESYCLGVYGQKHDCYWTGSTCLVK